MKLSGLHETSYSPSEQQRKQQAKAREKAESASRKRFAELRQLKDRKKAERKRAATDERRTQAAEAAARQKAV